MSPTTIEYDLKEVLSRIDSKLDRLESKFDKLTDDVKKLEIGQVEIKGEIKTLDEKIEGLSKRIDNQEFTSRGIVIGLTIAVIGGAAKLFGWV